MPDIVSVRAADSYAPETLRTAVDAHFAALGVEGDLKPGLRVLLKPNLLAGRDPSQAVTTHPALLRAIAEWLRDRGVTDITLADSPGGAYNALSLRRVYAACGMEPLSDVLKLNVDLSARKRGSFNLITPVPEADYIINCCKLKTHGLAVMTAGVKNLFGCIPGLQKPEVHCVRPNAEAFAEYLIDLAESVRPNLTLLDAVDCMEGDGPGGGTVRRMNLTLASRSPYALDFEAARLMGLPPMRVPTVLNSRERGLLRPGEIELVGDLLVPAVPPFKLPAAVTREHPAFVPLALLHRLWARRKTFPQVDASKCVGCGRCAESCPQHIIVVANGKASMPRKGCISCFCCQEMCPAHAIGVRR